MAVVRPRDSPATIEFDPRPMGQACDMARSNTPQQARRWTVEADVSQLPRLREHVASAALATGASEDTVDHLELAISELATNAMQYDDGEFLTVRLESSESGWTLVVSNADGIVDLNALTLPDPTELSGRGLFLVGQIMDRVELVDIDGRQHIRCVKSAD